MAKSGFKRVKDHNGTRLIKVVGAGYIAKSIKGTTFDAFDHKERLLGSTTNQAEAEYMAENNKPNVFTDRVSDLSLWVAWNDAIAAGEKPLLNEKEGIQYLSLGNIYIEGKGYLTEIVLSAMPDDQGWDIGIISMEYLRQIYSNEEFPGVLNLVFAEKPYVLE